MKRTMNQKHFFAPTAWRLGGASLRRAAITLLLTVVTTATAWAQTTEPVSYIDADGYQQIVPALARQLTAFNIDFGDENETTGISDATTMPPGGSQPPVWRGASGYTLDGRKLNAKPTKKGLYIYKGKKVKK